VILDRRQAVRLACSLVGAVAASSAAAGLPVRLFADDGSPIRSFPAPDDKRLSNLPALLAVGPAQADVTVTEFFDYNCGYCRQAAPGLDEMARSDPSLRLAYVHNPILSPASQRAAEAVAATQALLGGAVAYDLHKRLLAAPGRVSEQTAFALLRAGGMDAQRIEAMMSDATVRDALRAQRQLAVDSRIRFTPTFVVANVAFVGWAGVSTMKRFAAAARRCGAPQCGDASDPSLR
jgi:protein-disulfide isomerase